MSLGIVGAGRLARWRIAGRRVWWRTGLGALLVLAGAAVGVVGLSPVPPVEWLRHPVASALLSAGYNPNPVRLVRPKVAPLSAMAELGRQIFFDPGLSSSGKLSCASCHDPARAFGPPNAAPAMFGGPDLTRQGVRAVPSLDYLERQPNFSIGPDGDGGDQDETASLTRQAIQAQGAAKVQKTAADTAQTAGNPVPQGGLFWDGRADTLQSQALVPMLNPLEMDGGSVPAVAARLERAAYAGDIRQLFGDDIFDDPQMAVSEAMFAVARYQIEDPSFHSYSSKYDAWLEGRARLSAAELRGYLLFNDPKKANCAGCHLDRPTPDGRPPLFTDHQYEALGVPRNAALAVNRDPAYYDLGVCGPVRGDLAAQTQYCGMFQTPTLRNAATRRVFFHNGVYHTLQQVLDFYDFRDVKPQAIYPKGPDGAPAKYDDLPAADRGNVDVTDPPFDRKPGQTPAMSARDEADIIAFLKTLTDGYRPGS